MALADALALAWVAGTILLRWRKVARGCGIALAVVLVLLTTIMFVNARVGYARSGTDLVPSPGYERRRGSPAC